MLTNRSVQVQVKQREWDEDVVLRRWSGPFTLASGPVLKLNPSLLKHNSGSAYGCTALVGLELLLEALQSTRPSDYNTRLSQAYSI